MNAPSHSSRTNKPGSPVSESPRKRVLIVGVGSIGERHARCFLQTGRARVGICELNDALRDQVAGRYDVAGAFADLDEALQEPWDAAVVATPAPWHTPVAQKLADAGVHMLIEKPLSTTCDGIDNLRRTVESRALVVGVAYVYRSHPALAEMRQCVVDGGIGKPLHMTIVAGQHFPLYRPAYRDTYYTERKKGGGAIQDALTHLLDAGQWLLGPITRLTADAAHLSLDGVEVEDTANVLARHDQAMASYSLNQFQAPNEVTITIHGDAGSVRFETHTASWHRVTERGGPWLLQNQFQLERDDLFTMQATAFLDAIDRKQQVLTTLAEGIATLHVNLAVMASSDAAASTQITLPPIGTDVLADTATRQNDSERHS